jgi:hypothetical protein
MLILFSNSLTVEFHIFAIFVVLLIVFLTIITLNLIRMDSGKIFNKDQNSITDHMKSHVPMNMLRKLLWLQCIFLCLMCPNPLWIVAIYKFVLAPSNKQLKKGHFKEETKHGLGFWHMIVIFNSIHCARISDNHRCSSWLKLNKLKILSFPVILYIQILIISERSCC